ncbi:MAG: type II toxin-antitoxin system VapC family toxin [Candidatus Competibacteraceae bacterium]
MTGLLLDTHIFLWWLDDHPRLPEAARDRIADPETAIFVSAASIWEIEIKRTIGKSEAPREIMAFVEEEGFCGLPIQMKHAEIAALLPLYHRDPFHRMLIAQSLTEDLTLVTVDSRFELYEIKLPLV